MLNDFKKFENDRHDSIKKLKKSNSIREISIDFIKETGLYNYCYNFDWLGLPIIQFPQDMIAVQEIIWKTKPNLIIETGIARGGSLLLNASILHLLNGDGKVIGIDIDIRPHNREAIENHPLAHRIELIQGSSIDEEVLRQAKGYKEKNDRVMVILDSNHTHEHVLKELELYSPLVSKGYYLLVMDTVVDDMPDDYFPDRPWGKGDNPKTAVNEFLKQSDRFEIDEEIHSKLLITSSPEGYLRCKR